MAHLLKQTTTHYVDSDGKRCKKDTQGARKKKRKSKKWYGVYVDADGITRRVPLAANKEAARQMLAELEKKAEHLKSGLANPFEDHFQKPLKQHIEDFRRHLEARDNSSRYVCELVRKIESIVDSCGFKRIGDISASAVSLCLHECRQSGMGVTTSNHYLAALKSFCNWLVCDRRTAINPVTHLQRLNAETDIRRIRRALSQEELFNLVLAARNGAEVYGLSGIDREMLYATAGYTGLRASELASLSPGSFDFRSDPLTVTVEAACSKRRRQDILPLHRELAERLQPWIETKVDMSSTIPINHRFRTEKSDPPLLWPGKWAADRRAAKMIRKDLEAAGIAYVDNDGRVFDFHALRHQFITNLARNDVHPKKAQELARHSTIELTMNSYTHVSLYDLDSAIQQLPALPQHSDENTGKVG